MSTSPGPLLQALDVAWTHIREHVPGLPPARITITPTPPPAKHDQIRWVREDETVTGLVVSADTLRSGAESVLEYILHEAAHVLCWTRGVRDTTSRGVYHTGKFLDAAKEVGLSWPSQKDRDDHRGYSAVVVSPGTLERYADDVAALESAIPLVLPHLTIPDSPSRPRPANRLYLLCACDEPRRIQISPTVAARGPVICGVCEKPFTEA